MPVNDKIKERRKGYKPNIHGDKAVNVKTEEKNAADVPATNQEDITPKKKDQDTGEAT
jgi:hypothetical protein